jgi:alpha-glucoside transport system permease protein
MKSAKRQQLIRDLIVNGILLLLVVLWTIPTLGLFISSFRSRFNIQTSGWWKVLPHREWVLVEEFDKPEDVDTDGVMEIAGATGTFEEFRQGIVTEDGRQVIWSGNKRLGTIRIQERRWVLLPQLTLDNYGQVLAGKSYEIQTASGETRTVEGDNFTGAFLNSVTVAVPATIIPILIAAFAAYGFAWMRFPGRKVLFILVVALLVVPLQIALVPILQDYVRLDLNGTFLAIWLAHTGFGLPLATYLLFNYIKGLPRDILESAFIDGASHFTIFLRLILPLSVPALASFAIFQFLWVWNDYLVALIFIGAKPDVQVLTMRIAEMVGSRGADWHLLTAGAFISMLLPLIVFFSLQRFFVRGLLAGSVKG